MPRIEKTGMIVMPLLVAGSVWASQHSTNRSLSQDDFSKGSIFMANCAAVYDVLADVGSVINDTSQSGVLLTETELQGFRQNGRVALNVSKRLLMAFYSPYTSAQWAELTSLSREGYVQDQVETQVKELRDTHRQMLLEEVDRQADAQSRNSPVLDRLLAMSDECYQALRAMQVAD